MGEQHPCFVHPFGGRSMYCIAILLCLQPLSGQNKDDVHLSLRKTKILDIPEAARSTGREFGTIRTVAS
jgi:hypothetical protein